ncbi:MAG: mannose-6-phosphate isomerase [Paludibacteraceae bacterium]|nr:mannose-6-phosphate isomerase [Paludibacteraceae bacterium]
MLYPLKFQPILKQRIWGGNKLKTIYNKTSEFDGNLGESWELSGIAGDESVVVNGELAGNTINELLEVYLDDLVGSKVFEKYQFTFPLLFKLIDANDKLSIQVHPNDEVAMEKHGCLGKTEMWYVIDAEDGAELTVGFSQPVDKDIYLQHFQRGTLESILKKEKVHAGDVFFIPAGLVHAIGKGVLLAEIQQSSDITYRIYDYNRVDAKGESRELHSERALEVINFDNTINAKVDYQNRINEPVLLVACDYFNVNKISFDKTIIRDHSDFDSFVVYMCVSGSFEIDCQDGSIEKMMKGETILVPAEIGEIQLVAKSLVDVLEVRMQ